jgi:hypothetical protein
MTNGPSASVCMTRPALKVLGLEPGTQRMHGFVWPAQYFAILRAQGSVWRPSSHSAWPAQHFGAPGSSAKPARSRSSILWVNPYVESIGIRDSYTDSATASHRRRRLSDVQYVESIGIRDSYTFSATVSHRWRRPSDVQYVKSIGIRDSYTDSDARGFRAGGSRIPGPS